MKAAVIFYSLEGNTKFVAERIAEKFGADIYELREKKRTVPTKGFMKYVWGGKQVVTKEKPELEELNLSISEYDLLFIGTPVWVSTYAPAIRSFFSKYEVKNKKVAVFCCHEGGIGKTINNLNDRLNGNEKISSFDIIYPIRDENASNEKIQEWLNNLKI